MPETIPLFVKRPSSSPVQVGSVEKSKLKNISELRHLIKSQIGTESPKRSRMLIYGDLGCKKRITPTSDKKGLDLLLVSFSHVKRKNSRRTYAYVHNSLVRKRRGKKASTSEEEEEEEEGEEEEENDSEDEEDVEQVVQIPDDKDTSDLDEYGETSDLSSSIKLSRKDTHHQSKSSSSSSSPGYSPSLSSSSSSYASSSSTSASSSSSSSGEEQLSHKHEYTNHRRHSTGAFSDDQQGLTTTPKSISLQPLGKLH
ncbi:hypothetical protein ADUPG1_007256, partial [Aduncisulcus paluster]